MELTTPKDADGKSPNCGITAVAIIAGISVAEATNQFVKLRSSFGHRKYAKTRKGGTNGREREVVLTMLKIKFHELDDPILKPWNRPISLHQWMASSKVRDRNKTYLVITTGHAQVVLDRTVADQNGPKDINVYWGRGKKIKSAIEID